MKKKLMMVAVLLGALSLGACVDDNESASVTNLRDAQAAKLNALAEYYSAQAQAELIIAEAQAQYQAAQAAYYNAQAAIDEVTAEKQAFELQKLRDEYERDLEKINLEAQTALLQAQMDLQDKEQQFLSVANDWLKDLYGKYAKEVSTLDDLKSTLNTNKYNLAQYEANIITTEELNAKKKAQWEQEIAQWDAEIKAYTEYQGMDKADLENQEVTLLLEKSNAEQTYLQKQQLTLTAKTAYMEARNTFKYTNENATLKTVLAAKILYDLGFSGFTNEKAIINEEYNLKVPYYVLSSEADVVRKRQELNNTLKEKQETLGAAKVGTTPASGLYEYLEKAQTQLDAAVTNKDQEQIDYWTLDIAELNDKIADAKQEVEEAKLDVDNFEAAIASFSGDDLTAYNAAIEAFKTADVVTAYVAAIEAEEAALEAKTEVGAEYQAVVDLKSESVDAQAQIASLETKIAENNKKIAELSNEYELSIQQTEDEIARLETQIEMQQAVVDLAKENLDNAIASLADGEETPETPSEEQPAEETPAA